MRSGLLTEIADHDEPGSWGRASLGWPEIHGDVAYDMYVFAGCVQSVPYGSYVLMAQRGVAGATASMLRVHAQYLLKLQADFLRAGKPDADTSRARRESHGTPNGFGDREAAPVWTAPAASPPAPLDLEDVHGSLTSSGAPTNAQIAALERQLAVAMARADLECYAAQVEAPAGQMPRFDVAQLNPLRVTYDDQDSMDRCVARAVKYLDLIGGLERPVAGKPNVVSITRALHALDQVEGGAA